MAETTNYNKNANAETVKSKIIQGTAKVEKRTFGKKIVDFLFSDKLDSIGAYLKDYVLGPSIKDLIFKMGVGALQMALFQNGAPVQNTQNTGGSWIPGYGYVAQGARQPVNYSAISSGYAQLPPQVINNQRVVYSDVSFDSINDAMRIIEQLGNDIVQYGKVSLNDFYGYAGITSQYDNWTLQSNGWYSLGNAHPIQRTDGRWIIDFPPIQQVR